MIRRKLYTRPIMIAEQFMADHFCDVCSPKYKDTVVRVIGDYTPVDPSTHFHKDQNGNHILDESEKETSFATTNSAAYAHAQFGTDGFMCWRVSDYKAYWAIYAQNDQQLALYEAESVYVTTTKLHS